MLRRRHRSQVYAGCACYGRRLEAWSQIRYQSPSFETCRCATLLRMRFEQHANEFRVPSLLIKNIGEFFTGDLAQPQKLVGSLLIEDGRIIALDPHSATTADSVIDAGGSAVMPGLVDGHVHPVFGEWTPTQ